MVWVTARTTNFGTGIITKNTTYFAVAVCSNIRHVVNPSNKFTYMWSNIVTFAHEKLHLHPLADHMTKLGNFTKGEIREFSAFPFLLLLIFDQILNNLIVCMMILHKETTCKSYINELACCS